MKRNLFVLATLFLVLLSIFLLKESPPTLNINGQSLPIELATTSAEQVKGLSDRREIGSTGLLFIFPDTDTHGIWMKDMQFSIDILWLDSEYKVIHIEENVSPITFPKIFYPSQPSKYVFEADSGFTQKYKIEVGEKLEFSLKN
jgi:hypothetical protein